MNISFLKIALVNYSQITEADLQKLFERKPSEGLGLFYSCAAARDWGCLAMVSDEAELRANDFRGYSPQMRQAVEWAHQHGASFLMLSPDCVEADFGESPFALSVSSGGL